MKSGSPSRTTAAHKTQPKIQAWSSLVFYCRHSSFNPSEAPPWDSRPVSGAGVVHYQLLHRPRSVPTALSPAPLVKDPFNVLCSKSTYKQAHTYALTHNTHTHTHNMKACVTNIHLNTQLDKHKFLINK